MQDLSSTQYFKVEKEMNERAMEILKVEKAPELKIGDVLEIVYKAMAEKGYNPINQIVGYIMSGDPTYITSYMNARSLIMKVERDELVEEVMKDYVSKHGWD